MRLVTGSGIIKACMNDLQYDTCTDYNVQWAGPFSSEIEIPENTPTPALRSP